MAWIELPHSVDCLVCGRGNPHGMKLSLKVDDSTGQVVCEYTPRVEHVGFEGIIHGGALATVADEAMVWAATWRGKRFCLCGEMTIRFRQPAAVGQPLVVAASVEFSRPRLIETFARISDAKSNALIATASGKYVPVSPDQHSAFLATLQEEPETSASLTSLRGRQG